MTTPAMERIRLDRFLRTYGSGFATLTRVVGSTNQSFYSVRLRCHIRDYTPEELNELIIQGDSHVIISATEIITAQWPGSQPTLPVPGNDIRIPRRNDKFTLESSGRKTNVENSNGGIYLLDELIRIEMQVRGQ
jgi:hypothetical protein